MTRRACIFIPCWRTRWWRVLLGVALPVAFLVPSLHLGAAPTDAGTLSYRWTWPIDQPHTILRGFRAPSSDYGSGHRGIDLFATAGTAVFSPARGEVLFAGSVGGRGVVTIDHGDGVVSTLEPLAPSVSAGDSVDAHDPIGFVTKSEVPSTSLHVCECLHIGARYRGTYVSPLVLLQQVNPAVLKPWGEGPPRH